MEQVAVVVEETNDVAELKTVLDALILISAQASSRVPVRGNAPSWCRKQPQLTIRTIRIGRYQYRTRRTRSSASPCYAA